MMKTLKIVGLGLLIWSLGLLWPEIDLALVLAVLIAVVVAAGSVMLVLLWWQHLDGSNHTHTGRPRHPSRPVPVA
ncbi:MAG: hypothetical protein HS126_07065 [Anaerolineales bacterium]|nr:hypothetical protein [Anaerolineales bacterium]